MNPGSGGVWRPSRGGPGRDPYRPVLGHYPPTPVVVKVVDSVSSGRDVARADRIQQPFGPVVVPAVPAVERRRCKRGNLRVIGAGENDLLVGSDGQGLPTRGGHDRLTAAARYEGRALPRNIHTIVTGVIDREGAIGRVHLDRVPGLDRTDVERRRARGHLELDEVGLLVHQPDVRVTPAADKGAGTDLQFERAERARVAARHPATGPY